MTTETKILGIIGIVTAVIIGAAVFFLSKPEKPVIVDSSRLFREDSNKFSTDSAKLTIVEFGDYQCPACAMAHPALKQALSEYPGQVNFVFRHFPLTQHRNAELAARSVEAAKLQNKLWEMHDKLYESQTEWAEDPNARIKFTEYASTLGMDTARFSADIDSEGAKNKVSSDLADGLALGINSTPTFYFNEELYKGGIGYQDFKVAVDSKVQ